MKQIKNNEMPIERLLDKGPECLTDLELLQVLLQAGNRQHNVAWISHALWEALDSKGLAGLYQLSSEQLQQIPGIGPVKAAQILCLPELSKRMNRVQRRKRMRVLHPSEVAALYYEPMSHWIREQVVVSFLDGRNCPICDKVMAMGGVNYSLLPIREILQEALKYNAAQILMLHNHPSGDSSPSQADIENTHQMKQACELMQIPLLDHIIIGNREYTSMRERGVI